MTERANKFNTQLEVVALLNVQLQALRRRAVAFVMLPLAVPSQPPQGNG